MFALNLHLRNSFPDNLEVSDLGFYHAKQNFILFFQIRFKVLGPGSGHFGLKSLMKVFS